MAFCSRCGSEFAADAGFCSKCGSQFGQPALSAEHTSATTPPPISIPEDWRRTFTLIEKAGGPSSWMKLRVPELTNAERRDAYFNFSAFIFGPFAYIGYGMWKRAISLTLVGATAAAGTHLLLDGVMPGLWAFVIPGVFGSRANADYYRKVMQQDNGWW